MRRIFGAKKDAQPAPTIGETTSAMEKSCGVVDEQIKKIDVELLKHKAAINNARPGPAREAAKKRALPILRKKKMLEARRDQLFNQQFNLEQVQFTQESMQAMTSQVKAMQATNKQLAKAFKSNDLDIDQIEQLRDEMSELMDQSNEIQETLGRTYNLPEEMDEDDMFEELNDLEEEMAGEVGSGSLPSYLQEDLPDIPNEQANQQIPQPLNAGYPPVQTDEYGLPVAPPQHN
mmetsp:Transcript_28348/g.54011  ORF Transcript_28348/g.54011 Transcript_28348/m.54011 type:complete len:233 (+) Transcript_28348:235-933(+)|eukprot:CAMPEP_0114250118 /NCGR_PEP_ID=MMETSP0058-20121206/14525_1 /TAXON_ID=36894 /ORGANISM="Pyramimonas parkeae, CCMP726" /LENGTH=232 /DNA_ID=CAMNT_0001363749 /DNA_START=613 /DNA_END=1311 /DNA_ORIENTATION=+